VTVHQHVDAYATLLQVQEPSLNDILSKINAKSRLPSPSGLIAQLRTNLAGLNPFAGR
jgi:hypothetical protein